MGTTRGSERVSNIDSETRAAIGGWEPASGEDIDATLAALPDYMDAQHQVFTWMAGVLHEHAAEHPVTDELNQAAATFRALGDEFRHVYQVHQVEHERAMRRYAEPRPGEETWNVFPGRHDAEGDGARRVRSATEEIVHQLGSWEPEDGTDFDSMLDALPGWMDSQRDIFTGMSATLEQHAVEPAVRDALQEAASSFDGVREAFDQVYRTHRVEHAWEMARYEEPKPGEKTWDV